MLVLGKFLTLTRMVVVLTMTSLVMLTRMVAVVVVGMSPTLKMELQSFFFTCPPIQDLATCTVKDFRWVVNGHPWNIDTNTKTNGNTNGNTNTNVNTNLNGGAAQC